MIDVFSNLEHFDDGSEPWCDLLFEVCEVRKPFLSGRTELSFIADAAGEPVGFAATIRKRDWKFAPPRDENSVALSWGALTLRSSGPPSDNLLGVMQKYYGRERQGSFPTQIACQAVALEGDPTNLEAGPLRTKLFFEHAEDEERYAEVYFHVDLAAGLAALNEKDPDYREPLDAWFSGMALPGVTIQ